MGNDLHPGTKAALAGACRRAVQKVSGVSPAGDRRALADALSDQLCKEVDQKLAYVLAYELSRIAKARNPQAPKGPSKFSPKLKAAPKFKRYGKGLPSVTVPVHKIVPGLAHLGKVDIKLYGDPRGGERGGTINLKVEFWGP